MAETAVGRVHYVGVYGEASPRNTMIRRGLTAIGVEVVDCRAPLWSLPGHSRGPAPRGGPLRRLVYELGELARMSVRVAVIAARLATAPGRPDAIIVAEFNHGLTPLAYIASRLRRVPLVVDFHVSLWETAVLDRKVLDPGRPRARYRRILDSTALRLADRVLTETPATASRFQELFGGRVLQKARTLQLGAPEWTFTPTPLPARRESLTVLYFGTWIPLHGLSHVIESARLLKDDPRIKFVLVGRGQVREEIERGYDREPSGNVAFLPYQPLADLLALIRSADITLGIFGDSEKARTVVSNKVWQCLAMGRPLITGDGPGARSVIRNEHEALLVPHADGPALASAILRLADDPALARRLAESGAELAGRHTSRDLARTVVEVIAEAAADR